MDIVLTNPNNNNNILEPITIKRKQQIRKPTDIKNKKIIIDAMDKEPIIKKTKDNIYCTL